MQLSAIDGIIKIYKIVYGHVYGLFISLNIKWNRNNIIQKFQFKKGGTLEFYLRKVFT